MGVLKFCWSLIVLTQQRNAASTFTVACGALSIFLDVRLSMVAGVVSSFGLWDPKGEITANLERLLKFVHLI